MSCDAKFWHWPDWQQLGYAALLALAEFFLFLLVYGGANWITEQHQWRVAVHCRADLSIPIIPWTIAVYMSLNPLLWMAPFVLRTRVELQAMAASLAFATLVAGPFFLLLPAKEVFPPLDRQQLGAWSPWFDLARTMAMRHNFMPSLHVAFTVIAGSIYATRAGTLGRVLLVFWSAAIIASTLFTHEHYLLDVATGALLGWGTVRWIYWPLVREPGIPKAEIAGVQQRASKRPI
jgi:membrane-associated phospholipid phosphatase